MTTTIRGTDNSAAAPALTGNDSDTGIYFPVANKLGLVTGGTERVIVDDSGNVGIGTSSPAKKLDISTGVDAEAGTIGILLGGTTANSRQALIEKHTSVDGDSKRPLSIYSSQSASVFEPIVFATGASNEVVRITETGNVGINTSSPDARFHVQQNGAGKIQIARFENINAGIGHRLQISVNDDDNEVVYQSTGAVAGDHVFESGSTEKIRFLASGGITFNGDTAAANALDDYEEGTWTPVLSDAQTGGNTSPTSATNANYTKIGNLVNVQCFFTNVSTSGMTAGNALAIQNFPFTALSVAGTSLKPGGGIMMQQVSFSGYLCPFIYDNATNGRIGDVTSASNLSYILVSDITSGTSDFWMSLTYQAA